MLRLLRMIKDKEIKHIMDNYFYVIIDTREKRNEHIVNAFDKYNIKYINKALSYGDYGVLIKANDYIGINIVLPISIERKGNLTEIISNMTTNKVRFENEMARKCKDNGTMYIVIEDATYEDIANQNYKNNIQPKQVYALLHTFNERYNVPIIFINKEYSPLCIYNYLKYYTREYLKNNI